MNGAELVAAFEDLDDLEPACAWDRHRLALREHVAKADLSQFLRWSTIHATMFVGEAPYIEREYDALMQDRERWESAIQEPGVGDPPRLSYAPHTSGNLVHQACHLQQWVDRALVSLSDLDVVYELGGGYGAMALLCRRLGFEGLYFLHDLPEFLLLQEYYLDSVGVKHTPGRHPKPDLFIALFSLSEIAGQDKQDLLATDASSFLFAYQRNWGDEDNQAFFDALVEERDDLTWHNYPAHPQGRGPGYWYLVGV